MWFAGASSCPQPVVWTRYNRTTTNLTNPITWPPAVVPVCIASGPPSFGLPAFGQIDLAQYPRYCRISTTPNYPAATDHLDYEVWNATQMRPISEGSSQSSPQSLRQSVNCLTAQPYYATCGFLHANESLCGISMYCSYVYDLSALVYTFLCQDCGPCGPGPGGSLGPAGTQVPRDQLDQRSRLRLDSRPRKQGTNRSDQAGSNLRRNCCHRNAEHSLARICAWYSLYEAIHLLEEGRPHFTIFHLSFSSSLRWLAALSLAGASRWPQRG